MALLCFCFCLATSLGTSISLSELKGRWGQDFVGEFFFSHPGTLCLCDLPALQITTVWFQIGKERHYSTGASPSVATFSCGAGTSTQTMHVARHTPPSLGPHESFFLFVLKSELFDVAMEWPCRNAVDSVYFPSSPPLPMFPSQQYSGYCQGLKLPFLPQTLHLFLLDPQA